MVKHCAGVIIRKGNEILLHKRNYEPRSGTYDIVGGFMEEGETQEECAIRETKEETGYDIKLTGKIVDFATDDNGLERLHIFSGEIISGEMESSIEGEPVWVDIDKLSEEILSFPHTNEIIKIFLN